jgi:tetratricopeptide (TPR) repeat protein
MSDTSSVNTIRKQAEGKEREYDWLGAAETYENGLGMVSKQDSSTLGEIYERLGYAFRRAAMQAENVDEFRERMRKAAMNYGKARESYEKLSDEGKVPRIFRCDAMKAYIGYWLAPEASEKRRLLNECWNLAKESLKAFEEVGELCEYGRTYSQLSSSPIFIFTLEQDFKSREKPMREAVESGEKAIRYLSDCGEPSELARVYAKTVVCLGVFGYYFQDIREREKYLEKGLDYWVKAKELSEEAAMTEFVYPVFGCQPFFGLEGTDEAFANYEKALEYGKKMNDRFIMGCALDWLTYHTAWKGEATDDPDERTRLFQRTGQYAEEAKPQFSIISFVSPRGDLVWLEAVDVEYYVRLAELETDLKKRRALLEKALEAMPNVRKRGEESGYPEIATYVRGGRTVIRLALARLETNLEEKKKILEEALIDRTEHIKIADQLTPFLYWNRGIMRNALSNIKSGLANLAEEPETKKALLQEAVTDKENAIELLLKELTFMERKGSATSLFATVGFQQYAYGNLLVRLYELTGNKELLEKATKSYEDATESYQKLNLLSRVAETYWKRAQVYDTLGDHLNASKSFDIAANNYKSASERIHQLKDFYNDHELYMQSWSEIEKARHHHEKQEYSLAQEHFEKAAELHKTLKQWDYLAPNYAAWAQLEYAEDLSRKEKSEEALKTFEQAAGLFEQTRKSIQNELGKIEDSEEKEMAKSMLKATSLRQQYCVARIAVEEAKILDKKGDHYSSSEKYDSAAETLGKITQNVESERDRKEFDLITTLSQAWAKMTRAEAEESPSLYTEASQLFEKAKELSPNERAKNLALGHSRFCRALEAGMQFADTGDTTLHSTAIQHLESAGKYYVKAGFQNASEYAKATELLLDAYLHIGNAKKETDPEKKAKLFTMAEKVLQTSAGYFMKAEHPEKREQVLRLFEKVKEERELALSLSQILHTPSVVSTTAAFTTPTPNQENSVGLERFENANIQANIITRQRELKVGENLNIEIEMVNAGKGPALLIKINELIPSGFELTEKPEVYRVEDSYLNMKGKRIDPLKTEEIKLTLTPKVQGEFSLKPTILYLDENGKYKSHEPEPINITVRELGIKGWIKGQR